MVHNEKLKYKETIFPKSYLCPTLDKVIVFALFAELSVFVPLEVKRPNFLGLGELATPSLDLNKHIYM